MICNLIFDYSLLMNNPSIAICTLIVLILFLYICNILFHYIFTLLVQLLILCIYFYLLLTIQCMQFSPIYTYENNLKRNLFDKGIHASYYFKQLKYLKIINIYNFQLMELSNADARHKTHY